jgi:hypothetical protein
VTLGAWNVAASSANRPIAGIAGPVVEQGMRSAFSLRIKSAMS